MNYSYAISLILLLIISSNISHSQNSREERHRKIREKLESSKLKYNYFAPSVHIRYSHPKSSNKCLAYYNEITVRKTVKHTYFCTIGFDVGYFGIQDHGSGRLAIFSVWDKDGGKDKAADVAKADRTEVLFTNKKAKTSRFQGEGSGAKTMMPFLWKVGKTYCFAVLLTPMESGTIYTAWISEKGKKWSKIASYKTVMTKKKIGGFYSFIEDYIRNGKTGQKARLAYYSQPAVLSTKGRWFPVLSGAGSIADDIIQNGHSGAEETRFFSMSGAGTDDYKTKPKKFSILPTKKQIFIKNLPDAFSMQK